jgi:3-hydroxyacyl-[acyl-carrier-protein] dehydratase
MQTYDIEKIKNNLPHRYPFLLVDRVINYEPGKSLTAIKNVSFNEPFFQGHFPAKSIMPGVLIIESIAQATGILGCLSIDQKHPGDSLYYLVGIDKARFKRPVVPGDQLLIEVEFDRMRQGIWCFSGKASVDGDLAASAYLMTTQKDSIA